MDSPPNEVSSIYFGALYLLQACSSYIILLCNLKIP